MLLARALVVLAAVAGALLVWVIADPLFNADLDVRFGDNGAADHVAGRAVAVTTLVLALLGWGLLELLERRYGSPRGDDIWVAIAVVAMLLSLLGPIIAGLTISATVGLLAIHITAGGILIALLPQGIRPPEPSK